MSFSNNSSWEKHIKTVHEGIKPFKCDICFAKFTSKNSLTKHTQLQFIMKEKDKVLQTGQNCTDIFGILMKIINLINVKCAI